MFTTAGAAALAIVRNVVASIAPVSGAVLLDGTAIVCADDTGVKSIRDVITAVTAIDASAISTT